MTLYSIHRDAKLSVILAILPVVLLHLASISIQYTYRIFMIFLVKFLKIGTDFLNTHYNMRQALTKPPTKKNS